VASADPLEGSLKKLRSALSDHGFIDANGVGEPTERTTS